MQFGYDIRQLVQDAQTRWLKPAEVLFILQNHEEPQITNEPPQKPASGSLFLFNKRVLRFFRKDGHNWRKKRDGRTVGEAHERLKVGNAEALNCYYAHGADNPNFQRRSFWMLDSAYEHIVLVHYRDITEKGNVNGGSVSDFSPGPSSTFSLSAGSNSLQNPVSSGFSQLHDSYQTQSSPGSVEVSSQVVVGNNEASNFGRIDGTDNVGTSSNGDVTRALRRLEEQLSLDDDSLKDYVAFDWQEGSIDGHTVLDYNRDIQQSGSLQHDQFDDGLSRIVASSSNSLLGVHSGGNAMADHSTGTDYVAERNETLSWTNVFDLPEGPLSQVKEVCALDESEKHISCLKVTPQDLVNSHHWNFGGNTTGADSVLMPQEVKTLTFPAYSALVPNHISSQYCPSESFNPSNFQMPLEADPSLTIACEQKFEIREISPQWGFANETTKVIIVGSFLCDPLQSAWSCMFGDIEVPIEFIQEGVVCCQAPPQHPGMVKLCITSRNHESCSEVREFEYRDNSSSCTHCDRSRGEESRTTEELLLLVRFAQMLLSNSSMKNGDSDELGIDLPRKLKTDEDSWSEILQALLIGSGSSSATTDWLLQELLKDKLQQWLSSKTKEGDDLPCCLSRKEQGIIHMIAGLGYEWALNPVLSSGVGVNFRDINGWTALHWAARFGREKMVAALIASGASAGAVTDPTAQDPVGRTPASIAAASGHKGLAGYLSEVALTSHLSSLTIEESELYRGAADVQAEITVNKIANNSVASSSDQVSLNQTLEAVRNAAQAAARIQAAFRAHSFRRRQLKESAATGIDEYGFTANDIRGLSAASKLVFRSLYDHDSAALSIQKNYRGYKGRKNFLALRQKVVKIQAHIRGYQVRKKYRVICWAVGIWDKVVLRWHRKKVGLHGFKPESEAIKEIEEDEDDDIVKVFRKEKVNVAIDEAVSRVLSMVESPEAREQYLRVLEKYRQAKAELGCPVTEVASISQAGAFYMDDDDVLKFL